jgi:hypothetical protein
MLYASYKCVSPRMLYILAATGVNAVRIGSEADALPPNLHRVSQHTPQYAPSRALIGLTTEVNIDLTAAEVSSKRHGVPSQPRGP